MGKKGGGGKGGKGKGNKLARMSEEERLRYLQHRADMEEEARRRKQQLIATFMKNKLKKEDAFSRLNLAKINQEWRTLLRTIKCTQLQEEINAVENECLKMVDRKNSVIRRLLCDLDESEEIYSTMLHSHMESIEKLITIHRDRVEFLRKWFLGEKRYRLQKYDEEMKIYKAKKFQAQKELECVFYSLSERANTERKNNEEEHLQKKDSLKNSLILKLEEITKERESYMERLWTEFQMIMSTYLRSTEEYRNDYVDLRQRDNSDTKYIETHYLEVARASDIIADLKQKYATLKDEHEFNIEQLKKYRKELHDRSENLKHELEIGLATDKNKLKQLVLWSNAVLKKLDNFDKRGKHILQIANFSAKFENDRDEVRFQRGPKKAFLEITNGNDEIAKELQAIMDKPGSSMQSQLDFFWRRYNKTKIDCACLKEEKQGLKSENLRLKTALKDYLININIFTGTTIKSRDHKFIPRPQSMKVEKVMHIDLAKTSVGKGELKTLRRPVTCIEANMSNAVRSRSLVELRHRPLEIYSLVPKC